MAGDVHIGVKRKVLYISFDVLIEADYNFSTIS